MAMPCYLRHLDDVVKEAGIVLTKENRKEVDQAIKELLGQKDCPDVWKEVKIRLEKDEHKFIGDLHDVFVVKGLV